MKGIDPSNHGGGEGLLLPAVGRVPRVDQGCSVQVPRGVSENIGWVSRIEAVADFTSEWQIPENGFAERR